MKIKNLLKHFRAQFYPTRCPYCNKLVDKDCYICDNCLSEIPVDGINQGVTGGYRCCCALFYTGKFKRSVLKFKFKNKPHYAKLFAPLLYKQIEKSYGDVIFDFITCVPMHEKDLKKRGYNQSELLAKELSKLMKIPYVDTLYKAKQTKPQHVLKAKERSTNLKGAFKVIDKHKLEGKSVLLLDDIVTTGATLGECAKTLQNAKPSFIYCTALLSVAYIY